ncbi:hypothetical protein CCHR01_01269 [Colletotrichum chrysophilum]|uniref:Uncharacterized protein n=1 Tax=Colletotrichum chrysophilum TaxID=1836956 RepID=A0AAD9AZB9_9PEZI|nr:hypothetical protein CCHR01_01269 [Colletotrichum chrysophilum]
MSKKVISLQQYLNVKPLGLVDRKKYEKEASGLVPAGLMIIGLGRRPRRCPVFLKDNRRWTPEWHTESD